MEMTDTSTATTTIDPNAAPIPHLALRFGELGHRAKFQIIQQPSNPDFQLVVGRLPHIETGQSVFSWVGIYRQSSPQIIWEAYTGLRLFLRGGVHEYDWNVVGFDYVELDQVEDAQRAIKKAVRRFNAELELVTGQPIELLRRIPLASNVPSARGVVWQEEIVQ